jgi:hypothetical protein
MNYLGSASFARSPLQSFSDGIEVRGGKPHGGGGSESPLGIAAWATEKLGFEALVTAAFVEMERWGDLYPG